MKPKFERGQFVLSRCQSRNDVRYLWNVQQYMAEDEKRLFFLGGFLEKEGYEFLPFEGNEHLLGTRDNPAPKWEPKPNELVAVRDYEEESWKARKFVREESGLFYCLKEKGLETNSWRFCESLRNHFNVPD